jgi:hypothetical protein
MPNVIKFKFLKNILVDIGVGGAMFHIPYRAESKVNEEGFEYTKATFDLEHVHELSLPAALELRVPKRRPYMTDRMYDSLVDEAHRQWIKARSDSSVLRKQLLRHLNNGTIAIVEDGSEFLSDDSVSPEELAVAGISDNAPSKKPQK